MKGFCKKIIVPLLSWVFAALAVYFAMVACNCIFHLL